MQRSFAVFVPVLGQVPASGGGTSRTEYFPTCSNVVARAHDTLGEPIHSCDIFHDAVFFKKMSEPDLYLIILVFFSTQ